MRIEILACETGGVVLMRSVGRFDGCLIADLVAGQSEIAALANPLPVLHDMRGVEFSVPSAEMRRAARAPVPPPPGPGGLLRCAYVVGSSLGFGMMRMFCQMRERPPLVCEVSDDLERAAAWLGRPGAAAALSALDTAAGVEILDSGRDWSALNPPAPARGGPGRAPPGRDAARGQG